MQRLQRLGETEPQNVLRQFRAERAEGGREQWGVGFDQLVGLHAGSRQQRLEFS